MREKECTAASCGSVTESSGGGNRSATGEPGAPEPGGGLTSSGLSERHGDVRLFYALLVATA